MNKTDIENILNECAKWTGYLEKGMLSYSYYENKQMAAGSANWTRFGRIADIVINGRDRTVKDGHAWCCMYLLACIYESRAGHVETTAKNGTIPVREDVREWMRMELSFGGTLKYFAGCAAWYGAQRTRGGVSSVPMRGAFVVFLKNAVPYHIGIVDEVNADGTFYTYEGNTNLHGSEVNPNGGAVARKKRKNTGVLFLVGHLPKMSKGAR